MPKSRLQLRALPFIVLAYLVAPLVTLSGLWVVWYGPWAPPGMAGLGGGEGWAVLYPAGVPACLIAELIFATPLLVGFSRYRWWWLNGWTACGIGFLVAFLPVVAFDASPAGGYVVNGVVVGGWISLLQGDAPWGLAGFTTALTFRLIAVRTRPIAAESAAPAF
jgi:hypothetical protein